MLHRDPNLQNYIETPKSISWDEYFILQSVMASYRSKDPSTKVGCVIVDPFHRQISMGYNGFVAGIDEKMLPWGDDDQAPLEHQKHAYVVHAEANAIMHASRNIEGASVYITLFPCHECAKLLASQKIKEVIYLNDKHDGRESNRIAKKIFDLSGIGYRAISMSSVTKTEIKNYIDEML